MEVVKREVILDGDCQKRDFERGSKRVKKYSIVTIAGSSSGGYMCKVGKEASQCGCSCGVIVNKRKELNDDIEDISRESIE